ncbi:MAG: ABC-2 transporter permease [Thermocaproicibacter melissae]|jgi:ABC-2 type transport system permease protein|uniref:ABC-2 transporter permease n=1 Tax=Thermocaproicibacter melissae TaxID=2966552 RepID=UPI0024B1D6D8|nr:ABC-2 transporter permease [Thermocaproicibacter melissae]WBY64133.1 ABC-2 transporter permease [Thermocaproicibacter melissae]
MKSLILKDLYNIGHNAKSMLFLLVLFACFISSFQVSGYIFICAILCSAMIITTFAFDDNSNWTRYAVIMPVSKKDIVAAKFIVLIIFCAVGSLFGLIIGSICGVAANKITLDSAGIRELLTITLAALVISIIFGALSIPLLFKFGAEKGRLMMLVSYFIPTFIVAGIYKLLVMAGVQFTEQHFYILLCCSPIIAFVWCYGMFQISYRIFLKKDL